MPQPQIAKNTKTPTLEIQGHSGSSMFNKKLVTVASYDKQHVSAYLQLFSRYTRY